MQSAYYRSKYACLTLHKMISKWPKFAGKSELRLLPVAQNAVPHNFHKCLYSLWHIFLITEFFRYFVVCVDRMHLTKCELTRQRRKLHNEVLTNFIESSQSFGRVNWLILTDVSGTSSVLFSQLTLIIAPEDLINFSGHDSFHIICIL